MMKLNNLKKYMYDNGKINRLCRIIWGALLGLLLGFGQLMAHPHIFIDGLLSPRLSSDGSFLNGTEVRWSFDQIYSSMLIFDFDRNKNGKLDPEEQNPVYEQAFVHLKEINYFLFVKKVGAGKRQNLSLGTAKDFHASIEDGKIIYKFFVPFPEHEGKGLPLGAGQEYIVYLEDQEYYIAFDSLLKPGLSAAGVHFSSKEFTVQNLIWGPYPVRAVSVKSS